MTLLFTSRQTAWRVLALALLPPASVFAQKAALVQNIDDGIRAPYQAAASASGCNYPGNCAIVFPAVPAGHRHMIEQISCYVSLKAGGSLNAPLFLSSQAFRAERAYLAPQWVASLTYISNAPALLYYEAGEQPRVDAYSAGGAYSSFSCTLSGRDVTVP